MVSKGGQIDSAWTGDFSLSIHDCRTYARRSTKRAQSKYRQIIAHEMRLDARLPADSVLDCATPIEVRGTGTKFNQRYYPESITRSLSAEEGYQMEVQAKN